MVNSMNAKEALESLLQNEKIYKGWFASDSEKWYVKYNKDNKSFEFGEDWTDAIKNKNEKEILNFIFYQLLFQEWRIDSEY